MSQTANDNVTAGAAESPKTEQRVAEDVEADSMLLPDDLLDEDDSFLNSLTKMFKSQFGTFALLWLTWIITGMIYYAEALDLGYGKGLYMAVNTGYSIGWGDIPETKLSNQWFSLFYVLAGASFVSAALGFFADSVVADCNNWYVDAQLDHQFEVEYAKSKNAFSKLCIWLEYHWWDMRPVFAWILFVVSATIGSCITQEWPFITGLYFAVSSLSTGGLMALDPTKTDNTMYFFTGVYAAFGVPLMALAMAKIAGFFIQTGDIQATLTQIRQDITKEEVDMLIDMGLADKDGILDKTEFIILCMVRTGAADPLLISLIKEYFDLLDADHSGGLDMDEMLKSAKDLKKSKKSGGAITAADKEKQAQALSAIFTASSEVTKEVKSGRSESSARTGKYKRTSIHKLEEALRTSLSDVPAQADEESGVQLGEVAV